MKPTPGPWVILEVMGKKFIAAKVTEDHPYFNCTRYMDVAGDEEYPRKEADMELICKLRNALEE